MNTTLPREQMLSNLLARIHRDGGHYEHEHGTAKAVADADTIIANIYAAPSPAVVIDEAMVERFVTIGWNACRKSLYAVCEDVIEEADRIRIKGPVGTPAEEQHGKGYHAGTCRAAKSIARGFNSMEAIDDDNVRSAITEASQNAGGEQPALAPSPVDPVAGTLIDQIPQAEWDAWDASKENPTVIDSDGVDAAPVVPVTDEVREAAGEEDLIERLNSHMGKQDVPVLLADCRAAAASLAALQAEVERLTNALEFSDQNAEKLESLLDPHIAWEGQPPKAYAEILAALADATTKLLAAEAQVQSLTQALGERDKALEPFASIVSNDPDVTSKFIGPSDPDHWDAYGQNWGKSIKVAHCRRAARALQSKGDANG